VPVQVEARAVAARGRRPVDAELRSGVPGLDARDRALVATDLRVGPAGVLDLDLQPVPAGAVVVIEAGPVTWLLAVRRADGGYEPVATDGLPRLAPGGALVVALDGVRRRTRAELTLGTLPRQDDDRTTIAHLLLGRLAADGSGRVRGEVALPDDLGDLALVLGLRVRAR
jgi:hypothetical protein